MLVGFGWIFNDRRRRRRSLNIYLNKYIVCHTFILYMFKFLKSGVSTIRKNWGWSEVIIIFALAYVLLSFVLFYFIDLRNAFGLRDWLFSVDGAYFYFSYTPFFFQHYGRNSGFAELVQWTFMGGSMFLSAFIAGYYYTKKREVMMFFGLFSFALVLMLMEDAGDVRHTLMSYIQLAADEPDQGVFGTIFEGLYFAVLGGVPLYALIRYGKSIKKYTKVYWYIVAGFVAHAIAASLSFVGTAFQMLLEKDIYTIMGESLISLSYRLGDAALPEIWEAWNASSWMYQIGFFLMDSLVEENIEIIGNAFFLAGIIYFINSVLRKDASEKSVLRVVD